MAEALYRKYRPQTFATVAEQEHVVKTIANQLAAGKVAHAYLFSGPRGVGKTTIARLLAKAINCEQRSLGTAEPCNLCASCLEAQAGRFLDTLEIDAASQTKVEETRENIIENVRFTPARGKYKVFIIDEVHMLSTSSFNALLKTLEEPPSYVIFILATTELHKIPATIVSRCQRFDFHRIPADKIIERLNYIAEHEGVSVDFEVQAAIARLPEGCLRDAESLLGQVLALGEKHISLEVASLIIPATYIGVVTQLVQALTKKDTLAALAVTNEFIENGGSMRHFTDEFIDYIRTMLFVALGDKHLDRFDASTQKQLSEFASRLSATEIQSLLDLVLTARNRSTLAQYPQLPLEIVIVQFCVGTQASAEVTENITMSTAAKNQNAHRPIQTMPPLQLPKLPQSAVINPEPSATVIQAAGAGPETVAATQTDIEEVKSKWGRCVAWVGERNIALPLILQNAEINQIDNGLLVIGFPYELHVQKLSEVKNKQLIEDAIQAIIQKRIGVAFVQNKAKTDEQVADLLEVFGGSVV